MGTSISDSWRLTLNMLLAALLLVLFSVGAQAAAPAGYTQVGSKWYQYSSNPMTYNNAKWWCYAKQGVLARPLDETENSLLSGFLGRKSVYIGVNDIDQEDSWYYSNLEDNSVKKADYLNWNDGEPNGLGEWKDEDCVVMKGNRKHKWVDVHCSKAFKALCQYDETII